MDISCGKKPKHEVMPLSTLLPPPAAREEVLLTVFLLC